MKQVASLRYGVIFKKAFGNVDVFKGFVRDILGIQLEIERVETEKSFKQILGNVNVCFDLYAEDKKNRVIVEIQHENFPDHYDRFLHYHCVALLDQIEKSDNYKPPLTVFTLVILTSGDKRKTDVATIDFDPKDRHGKGLGVISHKIIYLCPKYINDDTPEIYREWMQVITESMTEEVEESAYKLPEIQKILTLIEKNLISPIERAKMFDEYNWENLKRTEFEKGELKAKLATAQRLFAMDMTTEVVKQATGLSDEQLKINPDDLDDE